MALKANFKQQDVKSRFDAFLDEIEKQQIRTLQYLGEMCVKHARLIPPEIGFHDQTGNLRSSIGYIVFKDGVAVREGYDGTATGAAAGKNLANKVGSRYKSGIALVVTAGMSYAVHVESRGKDVLTSAESLAKNELPKMLQQLIDNIKKAME